MPKSFRVRPASLADVSAILALQKASILELGGAAYDRARMEEALREVPLFTPDLVEEGHFVLLEKGKRLVGAGGWSQRLPSYQVAVAAARGVTGRTAIVRSVLVHPDFAGQGRGRQIMEWIEADARAHGIIRMTMTATLPGLPLYERMGYRVTEEQAAHLPSGAEVELFGMEKPLSEVMAA